MGAGGTHNAVSDAPARRSLGDRVERAWIWSIVGYSILRFVIAWGAFGEHGANPWIFGVIDVGTAWPYAKSVAVVCRRAAAFDWRGLALPIAIAVTTFFAPYAYLWFAAGEMPTGVRAGLVICVSVLLVAALAGVIAKVRKLRNTPEPIAVPAATPTAHAPAADTEMVIDLRNDSPRIERRRNRSESADQGDPTPTG